MPSTSVPSDSVPSDSVPSDNVRSHQNRRRAESFGAVAQAYDTLRPTYPDALFAQLLAGHPATALDVGAGTGQVSRRLIAAGVAVTAVEIDPRMAAVAAEHGVPVEVSGFEDWADAGRRFDLITAGQSWHWIDPQRGAAKAYRLLRDGGTLALFWNIGRQDDELQAEIDRIYARVVPDMPQSTIRGGNSRVDEYLRPLSDAGFSPVRRQRYLHDVRYPREQWLALIGTHSDHSTLPPDDLAALRDALGELIDRRGGSLVTHYTTETVLAVKPAHRARAASGSATGGQG